MNIVLLGPAYPLRGGIAHHTGLLYRHLVKRHTVDVMTFSRQYPGFLFPGKSQKEEKSEGMAIPSHAVIDSTNPLTWFKAARTIASRNPDLLIVAYWLPFFGLCYGIIARLVRSRTKARVIFLCHNIIPHERRPGDRILTRFAFRAADYFIVQSHAVQKELKAFFPDAVSTVVHHPLYELFGAATPEAEARATLGLSGNILLFFGYVRPYKGLDILVSAMPLILKEIPAHLLVVGEFYEAPDRYKSLITSLGLTGRVTVVSEYVASDRVGTYFSACDVVVLPYRSATQSGIAQIAYHFDKPVISTDVGGLGEVIANGKTGYLVPPNDPEQLAKAVIRFYKERRKQEFIENVRREKKQYTWEAMVEAIEAFSQEKSGVI